MTRSKRLHMASYVMQGPAALRRGLHRFGRDESGAVVIFSIFMFICMLMVGGVGIDLMRFERDRMALQNTLDRAVLAAADLDQTQPAEEVVRDYFNKAGVGAYLQSVTVDEGIGYRSVSAKAKSDLDTYFLKLFDIDTLSAPASGRAEERIDGIEISLVLDVSGSMGSNSRLTRLKPAAKAFVDIVLASAEQDNVSISVVPYSTQVAIGEPILSKYNVSNEHNYSHCVNFIPNEYSRTDLSRVDPLERTAHFDPWYTRELSRHGESRFMRVCPPSPHLQVMPFSNTRLDLHDYIDGLTAGGNTSIDIGMKWGTVLLDPSTQSVVTELIAEGELAASFEGRPASYTDGKTLKVIVLMTDGENTNQYMINPSLRDGLSDVWYNAQEGRYSVQHDQGGNTLYWWPDSERWESHPYGNGSRSVCGWQWQYNNWYYRCSEQEEPGDAVRLSYPELFNRVSLAYLASYIYTYQGNAWSVWYHNARTYMNGTAKDQHTNHICDAAKDQGIVVYTVGFEAPKSGQRVLKRCASSDSHHFDVDGLEIADAFAAIAASISKLRLVQ